MEVMLQFDFCFTAEGTDENPEVWKLMQQQQPLHCHKRAFCIPYTHRVALDSLVLRRFFPFCLLWSIR